MFLDSPKDGAPVQNGSQEDDDQFDSNEDFIKVKLFFYSENKQMHSKVFPEEWYTVMEDAYPGEVDQKMQPWLELEVQDHLNFGEMLIRFLQEANSYFKEMQSDYRLWEESTSDELYEVYMAKKKTGNPKDDYPSKY